MRKWLCVLLMLPLSVYAQDGAVEPVDEPVVEEVAAPVVEPHNPVALVTAGPVSDEIVNRVQQWAQSQLAIPVPVAAPIETSAETFDVVAEDAANNLKPEDLGYVVLLHRGKPLPNHGVYRPDLRVVVVNVNLMQEGADDETFGRRMERQVIRGIGTLMGLELSPNPQSAMAAYSNTEELDRIGRNLDPPWLLRLQKRAKELGIPLDPESPNNFFKE
ncbi:MAG: hypothetical protein M5U15_06925 [Kiritimatiellae bacterium]|nr:hypothetical protein [Kiritimatiellia bacterium]